jgi:hypothetical protein
MKTMKLLNLFVLLSLAALPVAGSEHVYLQDGSHLRISLETYQARRGFTPVVVTLAGAEVAGVMDTLGRVFVRENLAREENAEPLFAIDLRGGTIDLGNGGQAIFIYEENEMRTRFWFAEETVELPLKLEDDGTGGTLFLGRMEIPAQVVSRESLFMDPEARRTRLASGHMGPETAAQLQAGLIRTIADSSR